jgi:hypothetical protein
MKNAITRLNLARHYERGVAIQVSNSGIYDTWIATLRSQ